MHIDSLITFKDLIKKYFEEKNNLNSNNKNDINVKEQEELNAEENIEKNVLKIFEKCEGLIFNSETVKNSYDAKDILVIVTEYNPQLRLQALQISIKLISHFLNDNKNYFLKNSNTILFYSLKTFSLEKAEKQANKSNNNNNNNSSLNTIESQTASDSLILISNNFDNKNNNHTKEETEIKANSEILNYFKSNTQIFKNLFYSLLKRDFTNNAKSEEIVFISELISNFLIKTETLIFGEAEIKSIFDFIFNVWKSADEETENSLSTCIVALTSKFEFLENYKTINLFFQTKIDYLLKMLRNKLEQISKKSCCGEHVCSECICGNNNYNDNKCSKDCKNNSLPEKFKLDSSEFNYKEINKHLNLFIKFFTVEKISSFVLQEYFSLYLKIKKNLVYFYSMLNKKIHNANNNKDSLNTQNLDKSLAANDISMEISEADFQNLQIKEEEKIYSLIILLYKNIAENLKHIINQNIQILNLKTDNSCNNGKSAKSKKSGCCGGKDKKANKVQNSGCCGGAKQKASKSGCCGDSANQAQNDSDSEADDKLIKNEDHEHIGGEEKEKEKKGCKKSCKKSSCSSEKCSSKGKKKLKSAEQENSELIIANNSKIFFEAIRSLITINIESPNNNCNLSNDFNNANFISNTNSNTNNFDVYIKDNSLSFYFEIFDAEIFQTSIAIIEDYLKSEFIDSDIKSELMNLVINKLKSLNTCFSTSENSNENDLNKIIQYFLILFYANVFAGNSSKDSVCFDPEYKNYFNKIKKSFYLKFIFKIIKLFLNTKYENADKDSFNPSNSTNNSSISKCKNTLKQKSKLKNLLLKTVESIRQEITLNEQIQAITLKMQNLLESQFSKIYFSENFVSEKNIQKYFSYIYMLSLDSELVSRFSDSSVNTNGNLNSNKKNDTKNNIANFTESEKQSRLIFSFKNFQQENFCKEFSSFNFNLFQALLHFTKLNKLAYKLNGFLYFSLYFSLKKYSQIQIKLNSLRESIIKDNNNDKEKAEEKMDLEEPSLNLNYNKNNKNEENESNALFLNLVQTKLKQIYDDFLTCFEKLLALNKNFKSLILNNLNEKDNKETLDFNVFSSLDLLNKFNNFLNYISLTNDSNVMQILDKLMEKIFSLCSNLRDLEITLKKETFTDLINNTDKESLLSFYFCNAFFLKIINGNINFNNTNNPYISFSSEIITRNKLKINFLKFNKKIYESFFDKNNIYDYLLLFKKKLELDFMQIEKPFDSEAKTEFEINNLMLENSTNNNNNNIKEEKNNNLKFELMLKGFGNATEILNSSCSDSNIYKSLIAKFILNFYLNFDFESLQENIDVILDHTLNFLSEGLCLEKAAKSLKNIIQYVGKNFLQRKGYNLHNIIENLVKVNLLKKNFFFSFLFKIKLIYKLGFEFYL